MAGFQKCYINLLSVINKYLIKKSAIKYTCQLHCLYGGYFLVSLQECQKSLACKIQEGQHKIRLAFSFLKIAVNKLTNK